MIENELFNQLPEEDREDLMLTINSFLEDNVITDEERDFLSGEANRLHIDCPEFWKLIDDILKEKKNNDSKNNEELIISLYKFADLISSKPSISPVEMNLLHKKAEKVGISSADIDDYVNTHKHMAGLSNNDKSAMPENRDHHFALNQLEGIDTERINHDNEKHRKRKSKKENTENPRKDSKPKKKKFLWIPIILIILSVLLPNIISMKTDRGGQVPFADIVNDHHSLIFQKMSAQTYLVYGTGQGVDNHHFKMVVYLVSATGSFSLAMDSLSEDNNKGDDSNTLYLTCNSKTYFPFSIDVDMDQNDIIEVEEINPETLSAAEYEKLIQDSLRKQIQPIGTLLGGFVGTAMATNLVGGPLGKMFNSVNITPIKNKASNALPVIGAAVGTAAGYIVGQVAGGVYACVKSLGYDNDFKLSSDISISEKEFVFQSAKLMIATQMMTLNLEKDEWKDLRERYEAQITESVKEMVLSYGWDDVEISFNYD